MHNSNLVCGQTSSGYVLAHKDTSTIDIYSKSQVVYLAIIYFNKSNLTPPPEILDITGLVI